MRVIDRIYIGGEFVQPHGTELFDLHNPATGKVIGRVKLGDEEDARRAITAARQAFPSFSRTSKEDRLAMLRKLSDVVARNADALTEAAVKEYGGPVTAMVQWVKYASQGFLEMAEALERSLIARRKRRSRLPMTRVYGLQAYVISSNPQRAWAVAARIQAGRVSVNGILQELQAPFGGVKQSGIGREFGTFAIEAYLEPKTILRQVASVASAARALDCWTLTSACAGDDEPPSGMVRESRDKGSPAGLCPIKPRPFPPPSLAA
jgi:acyl-CoA reductase-like NAD-dependent aldehyde dehydrogenase